MAIVTQVNASGRATAIRTETLEAANTCERVGSLFVDMIDSMWPSDAWQEHVEIVDGNPHGTSFANLDGGTLAELNDLVSDATILSSVQIAATYVSQATQIIAGAGLTGTAALSGDVTLNVVANADGSIVVGANDIRVGEISDAQHGERGGGNLHDWATTSSAGFMSGTMVLQLNGAVNHVGITSGNPHGVSFTNIVDGTLAELNAAITDADVLSVASAAATYVPLTRQVIAGAGLTNGGALSSNVTLNVAAANGTIVVNPDSIEVGVIAANQITGDVANSVLVGGGSRGAWSATPTVTSITADAFISHPEIVAISGTTLTVTRTAVVVETDGSSSQVCDTISDPGWPIGTILCAKQNNTDHDIVWTSGGNISLPYNVLSVTSASSYYGSLFIKARTGYWHMLPPAFNSFLEVGQNSGVAWTKTGTYRGVFSSTGATSLQIIGGTASDLRVRFSDTDEEDRGVVGYSNTTDALFFGAGGVTKYYMTSSVFAPYTGAYNCALGAPSSSSRWSPIYGINLDLTGYAQFAESSEPVAGTGFRIWSGEHAMTTRGAENSRYDFACDAIWVA